MSFADLSKSLSDIERKVNKSIKILGKGNDMNYKDAIKLGTKSNSIVSTINKGIKDYSTFTPSEDEAKKLLGQMNTIVDLTETQLNAMVSNQARFESLKVGGLVKKNVTKTEAAGKELSAVMISKAPASIKGDAEALEKRREAAFSKASGAFAGSTGGEDEQLGDDSD
ncbi:hypothetical protein CPAR01_02228 [Colletotrichum paranaense]|uniref:Uncharacterized protein n=6 Tax=Colletotrichum acutatum species complex TaxID=2707335 RepID=A0A9P9XMT4_9PEZI|nr:uncharacterized protein CCOS01_03526 [Colletotrichum costaricense]XP_060353844.1 uncharacterized protein CPAR01_02228 [Colletotrichum paranaense]XP_060373287.1 uncharacterized protein CTAM01_16145 [Colletotrichum tamarilloi]XP_060391498.1 uncharacterized protein CABS01_03868 [Colletotrichum abscissum]KAI3529532.1 hypothetical protein CSPX01_15430 [Colletotrichum filicis]KAK0376128.1 hypothetical protein CLIM01_06497 [Colletotrichum limetticola]KAK1459931.1 hypothetical protein CMEL01_02930